MAEKARREEGEEMIDDGCSAPVKDGGAKGTKAFLLNRRRVKRADELHYSDE